MRVNYTVNNIAYSLTRSKRKTAAIYIRDGIVDVRAPLKMPIKEIDKFVSSKEEWITKKLTLSAQQANRQKRFTLDYGDTVLCRNRPFTIVAQFGDDFWYDDNNFYMPPGLTPNEIKRGCVRVYTKIAESIIPARAQNFAVLMSVKPAGIRISNARSQWGSCSVKKKINFSWRLVMADDDVIDYVVVHELAHIIEMNHLKKFWGIVGNVIPDFKARKIRLKELQQRLSGENWV